MARRIALIGYGAIAKEICGALANDPDLTVTQVLVRPSRRAETATRLRDGTRAVSSLDDLAEDTDFVLECAGHAAVRDFGPGCLSRGIDFGLVSAGVLADPETLDALRHAARQAGRRVIVVPGAIGGIDALSAAGSALDEVRYVSRKPPAGWIGSPAEDTHDLSRITAATAVFTGSARDAALRFPKNANVVATVALAGIGFENTQVTLMADPDATGNSHRIVARGTQYEFDYLTRGAALPDNPRTSALTALSALRALRHRGAGLLV